MRILVAEDQAPTAESLRYCLARERFVVEVTSSGAEAEQLAARKPFDLVLLDLHQGVEVLRAIRAHKPDLPIMLVASSSQVDERVRALDAGADDSIAKPFAVSELAARIRAILRRGNRAANPVITIGDLALDRIAHSVQRGGRSIELSPKEFALLEFLMRFAGQAVTRTAIVENVWKMNQDVITNVVDVYINYLRRKVDSGYDQRLIRTVRGVGYQIGTSGSRASAVRS
jgi:DNA-binding response OmpR family regulator